MRSVEQGWPVDGSGAPLPWRTYAAIHFVEGGLRGDELVFEYGSGQSTKWLADRVHTIHSVEHDDEWFERVAASLPTNAVLLNRQCQGDGLVAPTGDKYVSAVREVKRPDLIVIDGRARVSCVAAVCDVVQGHELIVLDDSHRPGYGPALERLRQAGFARVVFVGPVPGRTNFSTTSVFFRDKERWAQPADPPYDWDA